MITKTRHKISSDIPVMCVRWLFSTAVFYYCCCCCCFFSLDSFSRFGHDFGSSFIRLNNIWIVDGGVFLFPFHSHSLSFSIFNPYIDSHRQAAAAAAVAYCYLFLVHVHCRLIARTFTLISLPYNSYTPFLFHLMWIITLTSPI